ncbi:autotransporter assembly complex protein TamA [Shewanella sp. OMA3-2]|uniref:autotransporter assembly complex protein TamA n=1 Tax=Shewanella sp. OMA3-2 TaxID=2908650 RepID=UPI001F27DDB4|nr:autotransporter assembly complex family protein [Shewanella sp. OMA3-2]UJF23406.1 autotransporter assembly complex protein TamA [Shewanella sp. OMA3-2]
MAADDWLTVSISGAKRSLKKNIISHLGPAPQNEIQRRAYLFGVEDNTTDALESMGYYRAQIEVNVLETETGPWQLKVKVEPGEPVTLQWIDISFDDEMLEDRTFMRWLDGLTIKPGDTLHHGVYEDIKSQLVTLALARGYFDGKITRAEIVINRDKNTAQINLHFQSGQRYHLGDVTFEGHTLNDNIVQELVPFKRDTPYATSDLGALNRNLIDTGYFSNIKVLPQIDEMKDGNVPVLVELTPRASHSLEIGAGVDIGSSSDNGVEPRIRLTWRTPQVNRFGHKQETTAEWSPDRPKLLTTYTIPLTHPLDDQLKIRVGLLRDKYGVTQEYIPDDRQFVNTGQLESEKYQVGLIRQRRTENNWLFGYSFEAIKEFYNQLDTDYMPNFYLFGLTMSNTVRGDNTLDPKSGFRQTYSIEYADPNLGSAIQLARLQAKLKWIDTFFDKHRFVARLDMGANIADKEDIPYIAPSLRYFAGGDQSIRGYRYQELGPYIDYTNTEGGTSRQVVGGRYLLVGSLEYQYYLTPTWRLATFIDGGNAFDTNQFESVVSVGGGVHWISPIGPIKFDLGFGLKETETVDRSFRFHLTMGTEL